MLPLPVPRRPAPSLERPDASWTHGTPAETRDVAPVSTASIPVLRNVPPHDRGAGPAAIASGALEPRRPDRAPTPLDREALEDAVAEILRDAARRDGLEV